MAIYLYVIKVDGGADLYEIGRGSGGGDVSFEWIENVYEKTFPDDHAIVFDKTKSVFQYAVVDASMDNVELRRMAKEALGVEFEKGVYARRMSVDGEKDIAWFAKKSEIDDIFKNFAFSKIVPFDVLTYRIAQEKGYKECFSGVIDESFVILEQLGNELDEERPFSRTFYQVEPQKNVVADVLRKFSVPKVVARGKPLEDITGIPGFDDEVNVVPVSYREIEKFFFDENEIFVIDTVSDNYNMRIWRKSLLFFSAFFVLVGVFFSYVYLKNKVSMEYYRSKVEKLENERNELSKKIDSIKRNIVYKEYSPPDLSVVSSVTDRLSDLGDAVTKVSVDCVNEKCSVSFVVKGIDAALKAKKRFKRAKITRVRDDTFRITAIAKEKKR